MAKDDISYKNDELNVKFNFRVAIIGINNNKILLQHDSKVSYYSLIGGRVKLGESTKEAMIREVYEETGVNIKSDELLLIRIIENFFDYKTTKFHELLFIYKVSNKELNNMDNFETLDKVDVKNLWIDIKDLNKIDVRPEIIKDCLKDDALISEIFGK